MTENFFFFFLLINSLQIYWMTSFKNEAKHLFILPEYLFISTAQAIN